MIYAGGPYQTNLEMIGKLRDLASIVNRIGGLHKKAQRYTSWGDRLKESIEGASPPVRERGHARGGRPHIVAPEQEHNPVITGLHNPKRRQRHRMRTPGSTGAGMGGWGTSPSVGAHIT